MRIGMSFRVSSKNDLHSHCEVDYPDIPMTMAGLAAPSLMMHQLPSSARSSASSSCSCLRIGKRRSRRIFINGRAADTICSYAALKKTRMIQSLAEMIFEKDIYDSAVMCAGIRLPLVAHVPKLQPRQRHKSAIANCHGAWRAYIPSSFARWQIDLFDLTTAWFVGANTWPAVIKFAPLHLHPLETSSESKQSSQPDSCETQKRWIFHRQHPPTSSRFAADSIFSQFLDSFP